MGLLDKIGKQVDDAAEQGVIKVARESVSVEREKEYCLWVKPTDAGWQWLSAQAAQMRMDTIVPVPNGRSRWRVKQTGPSELVAELSTKYRKADTAVEANSDIHVIQALGTYANPNYTTHLFKRITIDADEAAKAATEAISWDIDVFFVVANRPELNVEADLLQFMETMSTSTAYGEWVKVELNVNAFRVESIDSLVPFEFEAAIASKSSDKDDQETIRNYWDVVTAL